MPARRSQRKKVVSPPQEDPMVESSITTPQAGHPEPQPQPDLQPVTQTELSETQAETKHPEPASLLGYKPGPTSTLDQPVFPEKEFAKMSIDDGHETGSSSYRTALHTPEVISYKSPDVLEHEHHDDDDDSETMSIIMIPPCKQFDKYSLWLKRNFPYLVHKKEVDFIDNICKIKDVVTLFKFFYYEPYQWVDFLGQMKYMTYHKFIIELNHIWSATIHEGSAIEWDTYMDIRDTNHSDVVAAYKKEIDIMSGIEKKHINLQN